LRPAKLAALCVLYMFARNACGLAGLRPLAIYIYLRATLGACGLLDPTKSVLCKSDPRKKMGA
jgi:hypothetical protein